MSLKLQLVLYISLLVCIIISLSSETASGQLTNIVEKSRRIILPGEVTDNVDDDSTGTSLNGVSESINLGEDDDEEEVDDPKKFSWKNHQEDHSIYAHRSLMSTANIKRASESGNGIDNDQEEEEEGENRREFNGMGNSRLTSVNDEEDLAPLKTIDFAEKEWQLMFRSFDLMFDGVSSSLVQELGARTNLLKEVLSRLKPECRRDIDHVRRSVKQHKLWALRMVDSIGKIPSGITYGKFSSPGDYEECLSVRINEQVHNPIMTNTFSSSSSSVDKKMDQQQTRPTNRNQSPGADFSVEHHKFHGKYCLIDFRLPLPERPKDKLLSIHDPIIDLSKTEVGQQNPELQNYSGYASVFYEVGYMHAVCLPSSCDVMDLTRSLGKALEGLHIVVNNTVDCEERPDERLPWRTSQLIATTLIIALFVNATFATLMRHLSQKQLIMKKKQDKDKDKDNKQTTGRTSARKNNNKKKGYYDWATEFSRKNRIYSDCFSVQTNFERLSKPDPRGLTFVHYTRIVAMGLTVITHTAGLGTLQAITKPADASNSEQIFRDFIPQMLANAFTSIQIFFFMAGFMLVISTYPSINREKGHVSFLEYAIKRAIRLMPGLAATICLNFLWPLFVDGPMLTYFIRLIVVPCEINWWRTMAFLSNFDHVEKMCLRHSYFSASDYQLHILAFPLLILLYKQPNLSLIIAGILTLAGFVAQVIMILTKTVIPFMMVDYIDKQAFFNVVHYIHHPSWNHMSAFFYGFIIGYLVVKQIRINLSEKTIKRLWYTILPIGIASIFAPYFWNHYKRPIYRWQMVLYVLFDRFALLTACAWLSYATMVLGRKPAAKKQANIPAADKEKQSAILPNLPSIVALASSTDKQTGSDNVIEANAPESPAPRLNSNWKANATNLLTAPEKFKTSSTSLNMNVSTNLTRQRSSPNFQLYKQLDDTNQSAPCSPKTLRPAISSSDVHSESASRDHVAAGRQLQQSSNRASRQEPAGKGQQFAETTTTSQPGKGKPATISNVNTLCLILSRLTFQLYLFNMVVLWIDVNHSKYYWFFSYYFIITKALAIYICSSLMALVFFVTMESPSLTLYIMWVKSRAQSRADRGEAAKAEAAAAAATKAGTKPADLNDEKPSSANNNKTSNILRDFTPREPNQFSESSDVINMRMGSPTITSKPTFSYIDLSGPTQESTQNNVPPINTCTTTFTGTTPTSISDALRTKM